MSSADDDVAPSAADEIRAEIEQTRAELADTIDQLQGKLDVKAQAADKVQAAKSSVADAAGRAKAAAPAPAQHAMDAVGAKTGPVIAQANEKAGPYRKQILAGAAIALVALVVVRRRRGDDA